MQAAAAQPKLASANVFGFFAFVVQSKAGLLRDYISKVSHSAHVV